MWAGEGKGIFCFCRKDNCLECMLYVYRRLGKLLGKLPGKYSSHQTVGQWAVTELYSKQGFGARAVRSRGISSEPSLWPGSSSGSSLNFSFIILANCMVQKCAKKLSLSLQYLTSLDGKISPLHRTCFKASKILKHFLNNSFTPGSGAGARS